MRQLLLATSTAFGFVLAIVLFVVTSRYEHLRIDTEALVRSIVFSYILFPAVNEFSVVRHLRLEYLRDFSLMP